MRIVCPNCQAAYEVPESLLSGGKAVRCARCGTEWAPLAAASPPPAVPHPAAPPPTPAPQPEPFDAAPPPPDELPDPRIEPRLSGYRPRSIDSADDTRPPPRDDEIELVPRRRGGALIGWLVSLVILALLIWAAFAFRSEVMGAWPPSTRLYAALGLR